MVPSERGLARGHRLRGYQAFSETISTGRSLQRDAVRCFYRIHHGYLGEQLRVGFSISRNIRTAARKNRIRRWMRECYRRRGNELAALMQGKQFGVDVVFIVRSRGSVRIDHRMRDSVNNSITHLLQELQQQLASLT